MRAQRGGLFSGAGGPAGRKGVLVEPDKIKIGILGVAHTHHVENARRLLSKAGSQVFCFKRTSCEQKRNSFAGMIRVNLSKIFGVIDFGCRSSLVKFVASNNPDVVLCYWGNNIFPEIITIKKYRPSVKVILNVVCHPMGLDPFTIFIQNMYFKLASVYCDGLIFPSNEMLGYFMKRSLINKRCRAIVIPPLLSEDYFPGKFLPDNSLVPNVVFLGRMEPGGGQPVDDVHGQLMEFLAAGIHVFHGGLEEESLPHPFRHLFRPMEIAGLKDYATQFDAGLVIYNLAAAKDDTRFRLTIFDRLVASVSLGIPIAIPDEGYDACKSFLKSYGAVINFKDASDLKEKLNDRDNIAFLKKKARERCSFYRAETRLDELKEYIQGILV